MGLIHTPRTIAALLKGYARTRTLPKDQLQSKSVGIGPDNPYIYKARAGLFDVDYLGHMNNAAFLTHAELARWELTAVNGLLPVMMRDKVNFFVTAAAVRYRQQIRPVFKKFHVDTYMAGIDDKSFWFMQTFRYPDADQRARGHVVIKGSPVKDGKVIDARDFLKHNLGVDEDVVDSISLPDIGDKSMEAFMDHFTAMEESLRKIASLDDKKLGSK
jgi:acyl-CoA thioesterase FadM